MELRLASTHRLKGSEDDPEYIFFTPNTTHVQQLLFMPFCDMTAGIEGSFQTHVRDRWMKERQKWKLKQFFKCFVVYFNEFDLMFEVQVYKKVIFLKQTQFQNTFHLEPPKLGVIVDYSKYFLKLYIKQTSKMTAKAKLVVYAFNFCIKITMSVIVLRPLHHILSSF